MAVNVTFCRPSKRLSTGGLIHMKNLMMFLGAVLVCSAVACSSSSGSGSAAVAAGNCPTAGQTSKCSADPAATQSDADSCNKALSDATCGSKYKDLLVCEGTNQTCKSDNTTDTGALTTACSSQISAYSSCLSGGGGDAGS
jgi:hypothetical protein